MNRQLRIISLILFFLSILGCKKEDANKVELPTISTLVVTEITATTAKSGGNVTNDGGGDITSKGIVWSTSQNPTFEQHTGLTVEGGGAVLFQSILSGLAQNTTYYIRAYATNSAGTAYGSQVQFTTETANGGITGQPCPGVPTVTDIDGNVYNTVLIGNQCWMKENLKTTRDADGNNITRYCYDNNATNCEEYGGLYTWHAVMNGASSSNSNPSGVQGICPTGWHVPSDSEWTQLIVFTGGEFVAGGKLKESGTTYWNNPNTGATNETGFTALPGGSRYLDGSFQSVGNTGFWWTSTVTFTPNALNRSISYISSSVFFVNNNRDLGFSVRCVRN
jgi:uncharacterized protein (TIGR02145 family)